MDGSESKHQVEGGNAMYRVLSTSSDDERKWSFAADLRAGFAARPRRLSSMYFYDDEGSAYFDQIMRLPEYYLSDCETENFERYGEPLMEIAATGPVNLVDLGAGDGTKTLILLKALKKMGADVTYVPIDISEGAMRTLTDKVSEAMPGLPTEGLVTEYIAGLRWLRENRADRRNVVLFLGSNIGNFTPDDTLRFLAHMRGALRRGDLALLGFDLKKDISLIQRAYTDSEGITRAFNLNLLRRINREFRGDFNVERWTHHAYYNPVAGAMESYLVSLARQRVRLEDLDLNMEFDEFEPIHTEYSHKYLRSDIERYAHQSGFLVERVVEDTRGWFANALWRVS